MPAQISANQIYAKNLQFPRRCLEMTMTLGRCKHKRGPIFPMQGGQPQQPGGALQAHKTRETAEQEFETASNRLEAMARKMTASPAHLAGPAAESSSASGSSAGMHPLRCCMWEELKAMVHGMLVGACKGHFDEDGYRGCDLWQPPTGAGKALTEDYFLELSKLSRTEAAGPSALLLAPVYSGFVASCNKPVAQAKRCHVTSRHGRKTIEKFIARPACCKGI